MSTQQGSGPERTRRHRILMTTPSFDTMGGIQVYAETLHRACPGLLDPLFVGARRGESSPLILLRRILRDTSLFVWHTARNHSNVVHINTSLDKKSLLRDGVLLLLALLLRRRALVFIHGWSPEVEAGLRRAKIPAFRWLFSRAALVVVLARRFETALRELGVTAPIVRETTFVSEDLLVQLDGVRPERPAGQHMVYLSRALRSKGLFAALEVYRRLAPSRPGLRLTVGGDGPDRAEAERIVREQGLAGVRFVGHVTGPEKAALLREADLFLFPSTYGEGLPISLLEAMAAGVPAVTTRAGGIPDFFEDGRMGESADTADPDVFAPLAARLLDAPEQRAAMGEYNRRFVRAHCTAASAAERLLRRYADLAGQHS